MSYSDIEWLRGADGSRGKTWNPVRGCTPISPGCKFCYAERQAARNLPEMRSPKTGNAFAIIKDGRARWTGEVEFIESKLIEPIHWTKPTKIFVNSMSDLWHEDLAHGERARIYATMAYCHWHTFKVLTKRAALRRAKFEDDFESDVRYEFQRLMETVGPPLHAPPFRWPLPNVWEGVSVENQDTAQRRIGHLFGTPAALRWVSYEPALEWVDFAPYLIGLDWVVIGGESGLKSKARLFQIEWAERLVERGKRAGRPIFVKQLGTNPIQGAFGYACENDPKKGADPRDWPRSIRVREYPKAAA